MIPLESTPAAAPRIRIPSRPEPGRRPGFPLLASVTPVLAAGVIWAITKSPYVLAFAALGPVIAIAGYLDGLRTRRRDARRAEGAHNELNGKDVDQIRSYAGSITKNERFNRPNVRWEFWLVGHTDHDHVVDNVSR